MSKAGIKGAASARAARRATTLADAALHLLGVDDAGDLVGFETEAMGRCSGFGYLQITASGYPALPEAMSNADLFWAAMTAGGKAALIIVTRQARTQTELFKLACHLHAEAIATQGIKPDNVMVAAAVSAPIAGAVRWDTHALNRDTQIISRRTPSLAAQTLTKFLSNGHSIQVVEIPGPLGYVALEIQCLVPTWLRDALPTKPVRAGHSYGRATPAASPAAAAARQTYVDMLDVAIDAQDADPVTAETEAPVAPETE